ncbi:MAG TPA: ferritin-like domain-containing protein [Schlesneria sp.]|jgi:hypothetical protein
MHIFTSSREWIAHYQANATDQLPIPWEAGAQLTAAQADAIIESLRAWQLGETSEGTQMLAVARKYAHDARDPEFVKAVKLFIAEEQRHGELLGRFLDLHGTPRLRRNRGDSIFRKLRHLLPNMECWTTVVIGVETLALVYYRAIMEASESPVLRTICRQILKDEVHHLRFQYERLALIGASRSPITRLMISLLQRVLFAATTIAVWVDHHRALRAGRYPFRRFWKAAWQRMEFHWHQMRPDARPARLANAPAESASREPSSAVNLQWHSDI